MSNTQPQKSKRNRGRGQAVVELALVLPVMVLVFAIAVDFARVFEAKIKLDSATRDAAEFVASDVDASTASNPTAAARRIICLQFVTADPCADPGVVAVTRTTNPSASVGGTTMNPMVKAVVTTSFTFRTAFPYPFIANEGKVDLTAKSEYSVLWGR